MQLLAFLANGILLLLLPWRIFKDSYVISQQLGYWVGMRLAIPGICYFVFLYVVFFELSNIKGHWLIALYNWINILYQMKQLGNTPRDVLDLALQPEPLQLEVFVRPKQTCNIQSPGNGNLNPALHLFPSNHPMCSFCLFVSVEI